MRIPILSDIFAPISGAFQGFKSYRIFNALESNHQRALKIIRKKKGIYHLRQVQTGLNPMHFVTMRNETSLMQALAERKDSKDHINDKDNALEWTSAHFTAKNGNLEILELLHKLGANLSLKNKEGAGPIHVAAGHNQQDFIQELLNKGVHIDERDSNDRTALHYTAILNLVDVASWLTSKGALTNIPDKFGFTPIYVAVNAGNLEIAEYLHRYKDGYAKNYARCKLIHLASKHTDIKLIDFLHNQGHDLWDVDNNVRVK